MYPFIRMSYQLAIVRKMKRIAPTETHVSHHRCWPWDLDLWMELNNGRTLTLFDLGRIPLAVRAGLTDVLRAKKWGMTVAGTSVRYRRRIRLFDKIEMHSRLVGWDDKFFYVDQTMWKGADCTTQGFFRMAVTEKSGIVAPDRVVAAMGYTDAPPKIPEPIKNWINAENTRPWPPERLIP